MLVPLHKENAGVELHEKSYFIFSWYHGALDIVVVVQVVVVMKEEVVAIVLVVVVMKEEVVAIVLAVVVEQTTAPTA